ncbi:uncharacterized protein At4g13230-like [Musa acuminata AAA Group]|uniref:uncharacterized protein At4g13230-like n=1 Tax=Musa acuminata AAA Group TaxID=214697 RepID=UPI0008A0E944|nr:PREDICTED: uncharacterized protein At4g13230-like [Musa acuminata subsp. malaccensis]
MASTALAKFGPPVSAIARRSPTSLRLLVTAASRPSQGSVVEDAARSVNEEVTVAGGQANKTTESRGIAGASASQVAGIGNRAAEMAQDAWQSAKETTKKAANFVAGRAADTKESIKDDANAVKRAMNAEKNS